MELSWLTDEIAVGGGIWNAENMSTLAAMGVTHVIDLQSEFDDTKLASPFGVAVLWIGIDDDFMAKPLAVFKKGTEFAAAALRDAQSKVYIHCAAGVHRAPMMALALLCVLGWEFDDARKHIAETRPVADFPEVYLDSVRKFLASQS